jgi:hypothetical protein
VASKGVAMDIPELAYSFPDGHINQYRILANRAWFHKRYHIKAICDFDSDGNGRNDGFDAISAIRKGKVTIN